MMQVQVLDGASNENRASYSVDKYIYIYIFVCLGLWHINFCKLFNAKSIYIPISNNSV